MELLGEQFSALVDRLHRQVLELQAGSHVERLVLLEAESGSGKSRVVRELYERMRSMQSVNQDGEGYWPPLDDDRARGDRGREALPARKVIGPPTDGFIRPRGALPDFFWLQVQCAQAPSAALIPTIELMWPSLRAHAEFVAESWRRAANLGERARRTLDAHAREEIQGVGTEASIEVLSRVLSAFDVAVPGLGWVATKSVQAGTSFYRRKQFKGRIEAGGELGQGLQPPEELALQLLRMSHRNLPLIIVVEDAHLMDEGLAEALRLLVESDPQSPPVLVIATAWPEGRTRESYRQWRQALLAQDDGRPRALLVADGSGHPFPSLTLNDRVRMIRDQAPNTDQAKAELIAAKWTNPYSLRLALSSGRMQRRLRDQAFDVKPEHLEKMPEDIQEIYRDRWKELPQAVRQALMLAAGALPDPGDDGSVWPYLIDVVAQATADSGLLHDPEKVSAALGEASDPLEWSRIEDRDLDLVAFREWVLQRIALDNYEAEYDLEESGDFTKKVANEIARRINEARGDGYLVPAGDQAGLPMSRWLLALQPKRNDAAATAAALTVADSIGLMRPQDVVRLLTEPDRLRLVPADSPWALWAREVLARALGEAGRVQEAIDQFEALLAEQMRVLGPDDPSTLSTRGSLVWFVGSAGRVQEAIDLNLALLADKLRVLGPDHPDTLATRNNLAVALADAGRLQDAIDQIRLLLVDRSRVLGSDHPDTLDTRGNLAEALRRAGEVQESIRQNEALLADRTRWLGPDHLDTLSTRGNLAVALADAGQVHESIEQFRTLLACRMRVLGPDHPDTLDTRGCLASALTVTGGVQEAIEEYEALLQDEMRLLGPDHPDTLGTRSELAVALTEAGQVQEAIGCIKALLEDRLRVLGPDHPDTLNTRHNLAAALSDAGRPQEAIELNQELLGDRLRVMGRDHPHTLLTRHNLAAALTEAGRLEEAIDQYPDLLADQVRVLSADHPDTLATRADFASAFVEAGRVHEAIQQYEALLEDHVRVLGADHPDTIKVRQAFLDLTGE